MQAFELTVFNLNGTPSHFRFVAADDNAANDYAIDLVASLDVESDTWILHWYDSIERLRRQAISQGETRRSLLLCPATYTAK
jgi:hypothetical protein